MVDALRGARMLPARTPYARRFIRLSVARGELGRSGKRTVWLSSLPLGDGAVRRQAIDSLRQYLRQFIHEFLDGQPGFRGQLLQ